MAYSPISANSALIISKVCRATSKSCFSFVYSTSVSSSTYILKSFAHKISTRTAFSLSQRHLGWPATPECREKIWCFTETRAAYTSYAMRQLLKKLKITQSFSNTGTPHDNDVVESFFSVFKKEKFYRSSYRSETELRKKVNKYILFYNQKCPHATLNYQTPEQFEDAFFGKYKNSSLDV